MKDKGFQLKSNKHTHLLICEEVVKKTSRSSDLLDCSQSPIFSWDRLDIPRLTVTGILIFKGTEGAGVGDYSSDGGGEGGGERREK